MTKTFTFAVLAALLSTPAIAIENNGPAAPSPLLNADLTEAETFEARRALWRSYGEQPETETVTGTYWQDLSGTAELVQEIKSDYVVGKGIVLTH